MAACPHLLWRKPQYHTNNFFFQITTDKQYSPAEDCTLYNPPMTELGIVPVGSAMRGGYEEKPVKEE